VLANILCSAKILQSDKVQRCSAKYTAAVIDSGQWAAPDDTSLWFIDDLDGGM
jgi:hypothetical protein